VAVLAEAHFLLHGWLRSGNSLGPRRSGISEGALALLPGKHAFAWWRADAGFFDQQLLGFLEQRGLSYIVVARLTRWLKSEAARITEWRALDGTTPWVSFLCNCWLGPPAPLRGHPRNNCAPSEPRWEENCSMFPATPSAFSSPTSLYRRTDLGATTTVGQTWKIASPN